MIYAPWSDQDRFGSDRFGSDRFGSDLGSDLGPDLGSDLGSVRTDSLLYALLSVILLIQEIYLAYQIIPSTVSQYLYRNGTATHACLTWYVPWSCPQW
jgi:hypothetical protein